MVLVLNIANQFSVLNVQDIEQANEQAHPDGRQDVRQVLCLHSEGGLEGLGLPLQAWTKAEGQNRRREQAPLAQMMYATHQ
jgi:hypothetical protein